jgi:uncharacterized secreted protein with C-terminal beta-propeller domain
MVWIIKNEYQKWKKSLFDKSDIINVKQKYHYFSFHVIEKIFINHHFFHLAWNINIWFKWEYLTKMTE